MSRTIKTGLDYFPLDTKLDEKFEMIEAEHGLIGFAIIIKIYQEIYKNGYYYIWDKKRQLLFSKKNNVYIEDLNVIINSALEWNMFSNDLFNKYKVLTSAGIQKQFLKITERRKEVIINENIWLMDNNGINANIIFIKDDINAINTNISTQSKSKSKSKSKVKVKKIENIIKDESEIRNIVTEFYNYQHSVFSDLVKVNDKIIKDGILIIDKLIRIDNFKIEKIKDTLKFIVHDEFWSNKVLSLNGLRKKSKNGNTKFVNALLSSVNNQKSNVAAFNQAAAEEFLKNE